MLSGSKGGWSAPSQICHSDYSVAVEHGKLLSEYLAPGSPSEWIGDILAMTLHGYVLGSAVEMEKIVKAQWISVLEDLPTHAIVAATSQWLRTQKRKPWPSEIRDLAIEACGGAWDERDKLRQIVKAQVGDLEPWQADLMGKMHSVAWKAQIKPLSAEKVIRVGRDQKERTVASVTLHGVSSGILRAQYETILLAALEKHYSCKIDSIEYV